MKKLALAIIIGSLLSGCNDNHKNTSEYPEPEVPAVPGGEQPEMGVTPDEGVTEQDDPAAEGDKSPEMGVTPEPGFGGDGSPDMGVDSEGDGEDTTLVFFATSSYPRAAIIGLTTVESDVDARDVVEIYAHDDVFGSKEHRIEDRITYKGLLKARGDEPSTPSGEGSGLPFPPGMQAMEKISMKVMEVEEGREINLVMEESFVRHSKTTMSDEALSRVDSISVVIEGSGSITGTDRLDSVMELAKKAKENGVKTFQISIFASMDLQVLAEQSEQWSLIINDDYIQTLPIDFNRMNEEMDTKRELDVFRALVKFMNYELKGSFTQSASYDPKKPLLVYFGSSRNDYASNEVGEGSGLKETMGANFNNMLVADHYVTSAETAGYNIAFKPHPKTAWITETYVPQHRPEVSYFSSIPFELLVLAGGKDLGEEIHIPVIDRVDSTYSTILFSVDKEKIHSIIDYSPYEGYEHNYNQAIQDINTIRNYVLLPGWGFDGIKPDGTVDGENYEELANKLVLQLNAPHIKVTNVYDFVNKD